MGPARRAADAPLPLIGDRPGAQPGFGRSMTSSWPPGVVLLELASSPQVLQRTICTQSLHGTVAGLWPQTTGGLCAAAFNCL